jgi:hypothetical protein
MSAPRTDRLDEMLRELGPAEPPADFAREVMSRVAASGHQNRQGSIVPISSRRDIPMTRKVMWGLAVAAAVVLAVFAVTGFPPVGHGIEGTVGAAKKYNAQQMTASDVTLGDAAAQQFLQSEAFDRILKDRDARSILANADVRQILRNDVIARAIGDREMREVLASNDLARLFNDAEIRAELSAQYRSAVAAVRQASGDTQAVVAARQALAQARGNLRLARVLDNAALVNALIDTNLYQALAQTNLLSAIRSDALGAAALHPGFAAALASQQISVALAR